MDELGLTLFCLRVCTSFSVKEAPSDEDDEVLLGVGSSSYS